MIHDAPESSPLTTPLQGPSVSAWARPPPGTAELPMNSSDLRPWYANLQVLIPLLCLLVFVGFAVIVLWMIVSQDIRHDRQMEVAKTEYTQTLKEVAQRLGKSTEERQELRRAYDTMKNEQERRKMLVEGIPDLATRLIALEIQLSALVPQEKNLETQTATSREDIVTLKREFALLVERYRDLTYVRQPKIPLPPGGK